MKRISTLFLMITFSALTIFAQKKGQANSALNDASYVFKGVVTTYKAFKVENDNTVYASYKIEIESIYKGFDKLKQGTVEIITKAPETWEITEAGIWLKGSDNSSYSSDYNKYPFELGSGITAVFVCNEQVDKQIVSTNVLVDNTITLEPVCNTTNCFFRYFNVAKYDPETSKAIESSYIRGFDKTFNTWEELNTYLENINLTPQKKKY